MLRRELAARVRDRAEARHVADNKSAFVSGLNRSPASVLAEDSSFLLRHEEDVRCKQDELYENEKEKNAQQQLRAYYSRT
jgi:hypothetical protein